MSKSAKMEQAERAALAASMALREVQRELEQFNNDVAAAQLVALSEGKPAPKPDNQRLMLLTRKYHEARVPYCRAMDALQAVMDAEREEEEEGETA